MKVDLAIDIQMNLNEREQEIFHLRTQGYEFVDIAEMMGVTKARILQVWKGIKAKYERF
ncbi:hypothetical protein QUF84_00130 [Fictibacillus enclensis]|uniref:hypothetical protein n=1 Tax=Fictibacillus enclensis TaxID=1017270 RepID=UPI0025A0BB97|nr:hypothetical protein [Fictibacillus enclensis]MDM5335703.1 hypothetical protein [Fictibacillus enclensis]